MSERSRRQQLDKMFGVMTAQERAVHIIQSWKAEMDEEPLVRSTVPGEQGRELAELLALARCVNRDLGTMALLYEQVSEKLKLRFAWLQSMRAWAMHTQSLAHQLLLLVPEPVTESEAQERLDTLRNGELSIAEAALILAETDEDERDEAAWEKLLRDAIKQGVLSAEKKGRGYRIRYGDLADWEGSTTTLIPEWGYDVEVLPDEQRGLVANRRDRLYHARRIIQRSPTWLATFRTPEEQPPEDAEDANRVAFALLTTLKDELPAHWRDIRALELCIAEVQDRLAGEDPADEVLRSALDDVKAAVQEVVEGLAECDIEVELAEPKEVDRGRIRRLLELAVDDALGW